jgi:hypothetical protein
VTDEPSGYEVLRDLATALEEEHLNLEDEFEEYKADHPADGGGTPVPPVVVEPPVVVTANTAVIGESTYQLSIDNPRDANELVCYTARQLATPTNPYGVEVSVVGGKVTAVNDRVPTKDPNPTLIPLNGYVLSGHDAAAAWLRLHAKVDAAVTLETREVTTVPPATSGSGWPVDSLSVYFMCWSNSPNISLSSIPPEFTDVRLSFAQGDPPRMVGWGAKGEADFKASLKTLRDRGVRIIVSVGGAGGHVNPANRQGFINGIKAIGDSFGGIDGIDWDIEGSAPMGPSDVIYICTQLKQHYGANFAITMAPNGSNIGNSATQGYTAIAIALNQAGLLDAFGQQFYDAVVSAGAAIGRINQYVSYGLPIEKYQVGMMVGDADTYWTVQECVTNFGAIKAAHPKIGGAYLWEAGRPGTAAWAKAMKGLL